MGGTEGIRGTRGGAIIALVAGAARLAGVAVAQAPPDLERAREAM